MKSILRSLIVDLILLVVAVILLIYSVAKTYEIGIFVAIIIIFIVVIAVFNNIKNMLIIISKGNEE